MILSAQGTFNPTNQFDVSNNTGCPVYWQEGILARGYFGKQFFSKQFFSKQFFGKQLFGKAVI